MKVSFLALFLASLLPCFSFPVWAVQSAQVIQENATVFRKPKMGSGVVTTLKIGDSLLVSSNTVQDKSGTVWHKVQAPNGGRGYVPAQYLNLEEPIAQLALMGSRNVASVGKASIQEVDRRKPWSFLLRGLAGAQYHQAAPQVSWLGDLELSGCIPFAEQGYLHRLISLGAFFLAGPSDRLVGGVLIGRIYVQSQMEPEVRIRVGKGLNSKSLSGGVSLALNYPFSTNFQNYFSGFFELGSLVQQGNPGPSVSAATGLGFHF